METTLIEERDDRHWTEKRIESKIRIKEIKSELREIDLCGADNEYERAKRIRRMINLEEELFQLEYELFQNKY